MKKVILSFLALVAMSFFTDAQTVPRDKVIVEIGTGTWCYYCPGAALGADDLISNGKDVAIIENHGPMGSDPFATTSSVARNTFYGLTGYPTAWFDGGNAVVGGNHTSSMYSTYLSKYNQRIAVPSDFTMSMSGINSGLDYTVVVNSELVGSYAGTGIVLHFVLTESEITYNWQGLNNLNFVSRLMVPDQNGTAMDFTTQNPINVQLNFSLDPSWIPENCELIAFLQDNSTRQILQGIKVNLEDLMPLTMNNAMCQAISMVPVTNCSGEVAPIVTISNAGGNDLTSLDINYRVNNETVNTYNWTGNLAYGEMENVTLPAVIFSIMPDNNLLVYTTNPNGNPDEDPMNDTTSTDFMQAMQVVPDIYLFLKLDDNPGETTYDLKNSAGDIIYTGGPFSTPQAFVKDTFALSMSDCYTFTIHDQGGDGLTNGGYYALRQSNLSLIYEDDSFSGGEEMAQFSADVVGIDDNQAGLDNLSLFPNPVDDVMNLSFGLNNAKSSVEITVYSVLGDVVYHLDQQTFETGNHTVNIDLGGLQSGIYFMSFKSGYTVQTRKFTVK